MTLAGGEVIEFFAVVVTMKYGSALRRYDGLRQALFAVAVNIGMHKFADDGAVFGNERRHTII